MRQPRTRNALVGWLRALLTPHGVMECGRLQSETAGPRELDLRNEEIQMLVTPADYRA